MTNGQAASPKDPAHVTRQLQPSCKLASLSTCTAYVQQTNLQTSGQACCTPPTPCRTTSHLPRPFQLGPFPTVHDPLHKSHANWLNSGHCAQHGCPFRRAALRHPYACRLFTLAPREAPIYCSIKLPNSSWFIHAGHYLESAFHWLYKGHEIISKRVGSQAN